MIDKVEFNGLLLGLIIRSNYNIDEGIKFFTPQHFSQQVGIMRRLRGHLILPHRHNIVERKVFLTQEVLIIRSGKLRVDFYTDDEVYFTSRYLFSGDVILLASGGHGFEILEDAEIIEVKQGPFSSELDKVRFDSITTDKINFIN